MEISHRYDFKRDNLLISALEEFFATQSISTSILQRKFKIGYSRAQNILSCFETLGIISSQGTDTPRKMLMEKDLAIKLIIDNNITENYTDTTLREINTIQYQITNIDEIQNIIISQPNENIIKPLMDRFISKLSPSVVKTIIINTDIIKQDCYNGDLHCMVPVICNLNFAITSLEYIEKEMLSRYDKLKQTNTTNIIEYNKICSEKLYNIIILIDEIDDIYKYNSAVAERVLCNMLDKGKIVGIHFIMATRHSVKNIKIGKISKFVDIVDMYKIEDIVNMLAEIEINTKNEIGKQLNKVDKEMTGLEFEQYTNYILRCNGFNNIQVTKSSGDFGADVIAYKDDVKYAIQCKKYTQPVGVTAIQEVIASKTMYNCHVAVVLTNSIFTNNAIELAKVNGVLLWDRKKLQALLKNTEN